MAAVIIYTSATCSYCVRAKSLLSQKGISFTEIRVDKDEEKRKEMLVRSNGQRTVPQIFINDRHIGGYEELWALEQKGQLDRLVNSN